MMVVLCVRRGLWCGVEACSAAVPVEAGGLQFGVVVVVVVVVGVRMMMMMIDACDTFSWWWLPAVHLTAAV